MKGAFKIVSNTFQLHKFVVGLNHSLICRVEREYKITFRIPRRTYLYLLQQFVQGTHKIVPQEAIIVSSSWRYDIYILLMNFC